MRLKAGERQAVPALGEGARDNAHRQPVFLQHRPLLDMGFEIGVNRTAPERFGAFIANAIQILFQRVAVRIEHRIGIL